MIIKNPRPAMALFVAIASVALFSLLAIHVFHTNSMVQHNKNIYELQNQAMFHLDFFTKLIQKTALHSCVPKLYFEDTHFKIEAHLHYIQNSSDCSQGTAKVDLFVSYKQPSLYLINLHHRFMKQF